GPLSKKAVSYSSPSIMKCFPFFTAKLEPKFSAIPPMRNEGSIPADWNIQASIEVVVVLPCVPATTRDSRVRRKSSCKTCGNERNGMRSSRTDSSSGLPREIALPTTTTSGRDERFDSEYGCMTLMPSLSKKSDMGGYAAASEPVTSYP